MSIASVLSPTVGLSLNDLPIIASTGTFKDNTSSHQSRLGVGPETFSW